MMLLSSFSVGHLLFDMPPTLRVVCFPSETPLEKINFSFASGYRLEIGGLGMGARIHFSFSSGTPSGAYPILQHFSSSSAEFPDPWGERFDADILFRAECSQVQSSGCGSPYFFLSAAGGNFADDGWAREASM